MATIREKIAGLYIAFFNRAGDRAGVEYWESEAVTLGEDIAIKKLASGFSTHPKFADMYDGLSNIEFVEEIYKNTLGSEGDEAGINYWANQLDDGVSRSDMVADFISLALDFNPNEPQYANLSQEDTDIALKRQALISNKVDTSLKYIDLLGDKTNLEAGTDPSNPSSLESDTSYQASIKVISSITDDERTVESVIDGLEVLKDRDDAISILNSVSEINRDTISDYLNNSISTPSQFSYVNSGLGDLPTSSTKGVQELDSMEHWDKDEITFSFNNTIPASYYEYDKIEEEWTPLNSEQRDTTRSIVSEINNLLDIELKEVSDNGDIRFNILDMAQDDMAGFSFYPSENPDYGGDIFLSSEFNNPNSEYDYGLNRGEGGWATITHELGHALGLKHPFEGSHSLSSLQDDMNHTIMSYIPKNNTIFNFTVLDSENIKADYSVITPNLYSLYDISALQTIYGANQTYRAGNDTYSTKYTDFEIQTIYDAGGEDTIDLSDTNGDTTLDLRGGTLNSVDEHSLEEIIALYQEGITNKGMQDWIRNIVVEAYQEEILYTGKDNFSIAQGVIIENIITGSGDDTITDNLVDNRISTGLGDDKIYLGNGGFDHIDGGEGEDSIYLTLLESQVNIKQLDNQTYSIMADNFYAEIKNIETIYFGDNSHIEIV